MRVTANRQFLARIHSNFHHCRLGVHEILYSLDYLEDILAVDLLAILEPLDHVIDKLLGHFVPEAHTVVAIVDLHRIDVQPLECRWRFGNLNRLLEFYTANQFLTICQLKLRIAVAGLAFHHSLEILEGRLVVENGRVCQGTTPEGLNRQRQNLVLLVSVYQQVQTGGPTLT